MGQDVQQLPDGHPIPWSELKPFEQQQGGYWFYPPGCDVYGNGKIWVRMPGPERPGEMTGFLNRLSRLTQDVSSRARDTGNADMAALGKELRQIQATRTVRTAAAQSS